MSFDVKDPRVIGHELNREKLLLKDNKYTAKSRQLWVPRYFLNEGLKPDDDESDIEKH